MSSQNPCHHDCTDWTDGDDPSAMLGCCGPIPVRMGCEAPVLPVPECDEEDPVVTFDEDAQEFVVTTKLYDENCSVIRDENDDDILTQIT